MKAAVDEASDLGSGWTRGCQGNAELQPCLQKLLPLRGIANRWQGDFGKIISALGLPLWLLPVVEVPFNEGSVIGSTGWLLFWYVALTLSHVRETER